MAADVGGVLWLPLILALVLALLTAGTYAELITKYPHAGGAARYADRAFDKPCVTFLTGFLVLSPGITTAAARERLAGDDHTRIAYSEILDDEKKDTAAGFWERAKAFYASLGIQVTAVMTDNGSCYRSHAFKAALGEGIKHRRTRPYRPQTNGKVERFNRTLEHEWAYGKTYRSEAERAVDYPTWLHHYNHHRPHTGIDGLTPMQRLHNVTGKNS